MSKDEFDSQGWTGGMKARLNNSILFIDEYDVVSVDFEFKTVELEIDKQCLDFSYTEVEIIREVKDNE